MDFTDLDRYLRTVWLALASSAGLGVVTMAVVQLIKDLSPLRTLWQRRWIEAVVAEQGQKTKVAAAQDVLPDLINLAAAFALGIEQAAYGVAVGRFGQPVGLPAERIDTGLGHSEYWPSEDTADRIARMLGAATPRSLPDRTLASAGSPLSRELPVRDVLG